MPVGNPRPMTDTPRRITPILVALITIIVASAPVVAVVPYGGPTAGSAGTAPGAAAVGHSAGVAASSGPSAAGGPPGPSATGGPAADESGPRIDGVPSDGSDNSTAPRNGPGGTVSADSGSETDASGPAATTSDGTATADATPGDAVPTVRNGDADEPVATGDSKDSPKIQDGLLVGLDSSTAVPQGVDAQVRNGQTFVQVVVEAAPGAAGRVASLARQNGGTVEVRAGGAVQVRVPQAALTGLAKSEAVSYVRRPRRPQTTAVTSRGVANMLADEVHAEGYTGEDVTVAVIDTDFDLTNPEIADNVVEFNDVGSNGFTNVTGAHGTATTELVVDTAPDVNVVAVRIETATELHRAINWLDNRNLGNASKDMHAVSMSLGFFNGGPLDGTSQMGQRIEGSIANGTQWFVSAGNEANGAHLNITWTDPDGDDFLEFSGSDECIGLPPVSEPAPIFVQWDDWPGSSNDYDIGLFNQSGTNIVRASTDVQSGSQPPTEFLGVLPRDGQTCMRIQNFSANGNAEFNIFTGAALEYSTAAQSITLPATNEELVTVGAMNSFHGVLEPFSSRGPTIDGRRKPDLVAPDNVTTTALNPFFGTSAAAPHTAGVAALLKDADPSLSPAQVKSTLMDTTSVDVTAGEPNSKSGTGLVDAENATLSLSTTPPQSISIDGTVEDSTGSPAVDDTVLAFPEAPTSDHGSLTDGSGNFAITADGSNQNYQVAYFQGNGSQQSSTSFMPIDGVPDVFSVANVPGNASTDLGTVSLPAGHVLNVSVVDESGAPVAGAEVDVIHSNQGGFAGFGDMSTGADGLIRPGGGSAPGIEVTGNVSVTVTPPGENSRFVDEETFRNVQVTADRDLVVELDERHNVSGRLEVAGGAAATGDLVAIVGATDASLQPVPTNATGDYQATLNGSDTYGFTFVQQNASGSLTSRDGTADLFAFEQRVVSGDADLGTRTLPAGHVVNVSVVDATGAPVEDAVVDIASRQREFPNTTIGLELNTTADGLVEPSPADGPGIELSGNVSIEVLPPDGSNNFVEQAYVRRLTVTSDRTVTIQLDQQIDVTGQVDEADGTPAVDDTLLAAAPDGSGIGDQLTLTDGTGAFTLADLFATVPYHVGYFQANHTATSGSSSFMPKDGSVDIYAVDVVNDTADVALGTVALPPGHTVNVTVENESGAPVDDAQVGVIHENAATGAETGLTAATNTAGLLQIGPHVGVELNGTAQFLVRPPENSTGFVNDTYVRNVTVDGEQSLTVTLQEIGPFAVTTDGASNVTTTTADLTGTLTGLGSSSTADVQFKYWVKGDEANASFTPFRTRTTTGQFTEDVTGLDPGTTYVFRAQARNGSGVYTTGGTVEFTTQASFGVTTAATTNVTDTTATFGGDLTGLGGSASADVQFKYWVQGQQSTTTQFTPFRTKTATGPFTEDVTGLSPNTTYVVRAQARDASGTYTTGGTVQFTTATGFGVTTGTADNVTRSSATLHGTLDGLGDAASADVQFKYWVQGQQGSTTQFTSFQTLTSAGAFSADVSGLSANTTYVFRAQARDSTGTWTAGSNAQFTTVDVHDVDTESASNVTANTATFEATVTSLGGASSIDVQFKYWVQGDEANTSQWTPFRTVSSTGTFTEDVTGLSPNTTYVVRAQARNPSGEYDIGSEVTVTTPTAFAVETDAATGVDASSATLNGNLTGLGGASSADVQFKYWVQGQQSTTTQFTSFQTLTSTGTFSASVSGLSANTTYVFRAQARDSAGTWTAGTTLTLTTDESFGVQTDAATNVTSTSMTLNGNLTGLGGTASTDVQFKYWVKGQEATTSQWTSFETLTAPGQFSETVTGLSANTTYVVRAQARNADGEWTSGTTIEVTTPS